MTSDKRISWQGHTLMVRDPGGGRFEVRKEGEAAVAVFDHGAYAWTTAPEWLEEIGGRTVDLSETLLLEMWEG